MKESSLSMMEGEEKFRKKSSLENLKNPENHDILYTESKREKQALLLIKN